MGLNADWQDRAYLLAPKGGRPNLTSGAIYLNDYMGDNWMLVQRFYDEKYDGSDRVETLKEFSSLKSALHYIKMHRDELERLSHTGLAHGGTHRKRNPLSEDGAVVSNPRRKGSKGKAKRSGGRTAAQSNAARAMKLFHSGKASSLAEAWDIIRSGR